MKSIIFAAFIVFPVISNAQFFKKIDPNTGHVTLVNFSNDQKEIISNQENILPEKTKKIVTPDRNKKIETALKNKDFPVVSTAEQKARDIDRREILNDELIKEKKLLSERISTKADAASLARIKGNIASLEREIANVR